jgi:hypothetical protein
MADEAWRLTARAVAVYMGAARPCGPCFFASRRPWNVADEVEARRS